MAGKKLTQLPSILSAALARADIMYVEDSSETQAAQKAKRVTLADLRNLFIPEVRIVNYPTQTIQQLSSSQTSYNNNPHTAPRPWWREMKPQASSSQNVAGLTFNLDHVVLPKGKRYFIQSNTYWVDNTNLFYEFASRPVGTPGTTGFSPIRDWESSHHRDNDSNREFIVYTYLDLTDAATDYEFFSRWRNASFSVKTPGTQQQNQAIITEFGF